MFIAYIIIAMWLISLNWFSKCSLQKYWLDKNIDRDDKRWGMTLCCIYGVYYIVSLGIMARTYYYFDCETSGLIRNLASPESRKALVLGGKKNSVLTSIYFKGRNKK